MASIVSAGTTSSTALNMSADTSGVLQLASNNGTTAATIDTSQNMTLVGSLSAPNTFGFKNRIINGGMVIDQRATSLTGGGYSVDRWQYAPSVTLKMTVAQSSTAPSGFINSLLATSSSAYSITSTDYFTLIQYIEGLNCADLAWGTSSAATVTLSFWVRSSLTGTFGGCLRNSASDRSYPFTYTISSANTWEQKSVTIAGDTSGTWLTTNGIGIRVIFGMGVGSTYSGTAGAWSSNSYLSATGATSVVGTNGATFYITGVQLEKGSTATSFDFRDYGRELILCQRYYAQAKTGGYPGAFAFIAMTTNGTIGSLSFPVTMRTGPTFTISYGGVTNNMVNISTGVAVSATPAQTWWTKDGVLGVQANSPFTTGIGYGFDYTASAEL